MPVKFPWLLFEHNQLYTACRQCVWGEGWRFSGRYISWKRRIGQESILFLT